MKEGSWERSYKLKIHKRRMWMSLNDIDLIIEDQFSYTDSEAISYLISILNLYT